MALSSRKGTTVRLNITFSVALFYFCNWPQEINSGIIKRSIEEYTMVIIILGQDRAK